MLQLLLTSCLQAYSCRFVFPTTVVFPAYTLQLPSICVLRTAFEPFCWNNLGILTGSSWHFSDISSDIPASWAHGSTSLDVDKANGMLTSNAKSIFSDNVTCFARSKHVSQIRDICKSASIAPHFLLARLQRNRFQLVIHLVFLDPSRIHLAASLYLCPADCFQDILFQQAGTFLWHKLKLTVTHLMSTLPNM